MRKNSILYETQFSDGKKINSYLATAYAEGFCEGDGASEEDQLKAWSYLIGTGLCWRLQGSFGRAASDLIENNIISREGEML